MDALLKFKDSTDLEIQSFVAIGFAKLSQTEENKPEIGKYLNYLFEIIKGENKLLIHQSLIAISNCCTLGKKKKKKKKI